MSERRRFSRVTFSGDCTLTEAVSGTLKTTSTSLLDISLTGALVCRPQTWHNQSQSNVNLNLTLPGSAITLSINGLICHQEKGLLGIKFLTLSLDSISHLKRLIQLNLGDETLLHREMSQLINSAEE